MKVLMDILTSYFAQDYGVAVGRLVTVDVLDAFEVQSSCNRPEQPKADASMCISMVCRWNRPNHTDRDKIPILGSVSQLSLKYSKSGAQPYTTFGNDVPSLYQVQTGFRNGCDPEFCSADECVLNWSFTKTQHPDILRVCSQEVVEAAGLMHCELNAIV